MYTYTCDMEEGDTRSLASLNHTNSVHTRLYTYHTHICLNLL
jgi:hypothetical protein